MLLPKLKWIICRVCLEQSEGLHDIFEKKSSFNIWLSLRDCGGVPVQKNDNLPDKICEECLLKLCESYKFRLACQRGHRDITHMLSERDFNMYEKELECERKASSDILEPPETIKSDDDPYKHEPKSNTNSIAMIDKNQQTKLKTSNNSKCTNKEDISIKMDTREGIKREETQTIEIADGHIKHYCIVNKKHCVKEELKDKNESFKNAKQERLILLLKLQNAKNTKIKLKTETKTKFIRKPKTRSKAMPKTKQKTITKTNKIKLCKTKNNFTCKLCNKTYKTYQLLRHHNYTHINPYKCKICGKTFSQSQSLSNHLNSHSGEKPFNCRICNKNYSDASNRNKHERTAHKEEIDKYKCENCDKKFRFFWLLEKHSNIHRSTKCLICGKIMSTLAVLREHHQRKHLSKVETP